MDHYSNTAIFKFWDEMEREIQIRGTYDIGGVYGRNTWDGIAIHSNSKFHIDFDHY